MAALLMVAATGLVLPALSTGSNSVICAADIRSKPSMACVDDFAITRVVKEVRVFDGDFADDLCSAVTQVAKSCIEEKGSVRLAGL